MKNREIKFRTFQEGKMYFHELCNYLGSSGVLNHYIGCDNAVWMQFTGLTDKNDIDIYEGDFYKVRSGNIYRVFFSKGSFCGGVSIKKCAPFGFCLEEAGYGYTGEMIETDFSKTIEVIGNIHENPELL